MKPVRWSYFSNDGGISLADLEGILNYLGFEIDSFGRDSKLGEFGRFINIIKRPENDRKDQA